MASRLSPLQSDVIREFFARNRRFHLTGGAALAGFLTQHRTTTDLDLFSPDAVLDEGDRALQGVAIALGATLESTQHAPYIHRWMLRTPTASVMVDLVHDPIPSVVPGKVEIDGVRLDPPTEIFANKLTTLLSRAELRDLVDLYVLERAGEHLETGLRLGAQKDGGLTPAQLADVLKDWNVGPNARVPPPLDRDSLLAYRDDLVDRLLRIARAQVPKRPG